jgi:acyl-CoA synthetase (AMP-forming)/AMP-acid ligase II/thioesterase domain-containing protein
MLQAQAELPTTEQRYLMFYPFRELSSSPNLVSYRSLYSEAQKNSLILANLASFTEGKPVLLHLDDHWDCLAWFWAVLLANGIPALSSPLSNNDDHRRLHLEHLSELLEAPICITRESSTHLFQGTHGLQIHTIESLLLNPTTQPTSTSITTPVTTIRRHRHESPAILMLTSGSTGNAKAVRLSHRQILAAVAGKASVRPLPRGTSFLNWIGLDHVASLIEIHIQALFLGFDQVHVHAADVVPTPLRFLELLSRHRVSRSFAPNFFLAKLVAAAAASHGKVGERNWDLSSLRIIASGGEANHVSTVVAAAALLETYGAAGDVIVTGFGMTETCAGAVFNLACPERDVARGRTVASVGRCMPGIEMRVVRGENQGAVPCETGETGHLQVRGEVVFEGYYRNPSATADAFTHDGWFKTGDQATLDEDGYLCLTGRVKDVININGVKVVTADLQAAVDVALRGTCASRAVVFPSRAPGAATEQITVAYLTGHWPPGADELAEIESLMSQACVMVSSARPVVFPVGPQSLALLPTTTLGKISGSKMTKLFEAGLFDGDVEYHRETVAAWVRRKAQQAAEDEQHDLTSLETTLQNEFAETMGFPDPSLVGVDTSIFDLGFSSMDVIRLKHRLDTRLGITIPNIMFLTHPSVRLLAAALTKMTAKPRSPADSAIGISEPSSPSSESQPADLDNSYDPVVTLCPKGSAPPLWLVHPGLGEVLVFVGLAHQLSREDRPVYALRARGFEPDQPVFSSMTEAVDTYVAAIRQKQPVGPYVLVGYSYGVMPAFEIAKRLDNVQFLGSFDFPPHIRMPQQGWNMWFLNLAHVLGVVSEEQIAEVDDSDMNYRALSRLEAFERVLAVADHEKWRQLGLTQNPLDKWVDVAYGLQSMVADYEPVGKVACGVDVFHAEPMSIIAGSKEEWVTMLGRWSSFCEDGEAGLRLHEVGGAHYTMIGPEYVEGFVVKFRAALAARGV